MKSKQIATIPITSPADEKDTSITMDAHLYRHVVQILNEAGVSPATWLQQQADEAYGLNESEQANVSLSRRVQRACIDLIAGRPVNDMSWPERWRENQLPL